MVQRTNASPEAEGFVVCVRSQSAEFRAQPLRLGRYQVVFEVYHPGLVWRTSEVLAGFKLLFQERTVYAGRAVISGLVVTSTSLICEVALEDAWLDVDLDGVSSQTADLQKDFDRFLRRVENTFCIRSEFKLWVADAQALLAQVRFWLDQVELGLGSMPAASRTEAERRVAAQLGRPVARCIEAVWDRFEPLAESLEEELRPAHRAYLRRLLHPLLLCSPFAWRTFTKPLGFAGDYEVVNMIVRDPFEGTSLFAKLINLWLLEQPPAEAHRNRLQFLTRRLLEETARTRAAGRAPRVFSLGCGPAIEVQNFLATQEASRQAEFILLDFNDETLLHTRRTLEEVNQRQARQARLQYVKQSIQQILKEASRGPCPPPGGRYDFIYCAGLFDYLPDPVCERLVAILHQWLAPDGLLLATNVETARPFRHSMDFLLDWHLFYRNGRQLAALAPVTPSPCTTWTDWTGVNVILEIRRPPHA